MVCERYSDDLGPEIIFLRLNLAARQQQIAREGND